MNSGWLRIFLWFWTACWI